ncbi:MAG: ABC transporter substrate-binding protein [Acidimicrobiia bacterium]
MRVLAVGLALVLVAAACGDDDDGGDASAPTTTDGGRVATTGAGGAVRGVTDTAITVGALVNEASFAGAANGARARFERANAEGGVHGRTIDFLGSSDDGGDAQTDQSLTRELIDSDQVFAVVPVVSEAFLPQSSDLLVEDQVPFVGWGFMPGFCGTEWGFGFNGCLINPEFRNSSLLDAALRANDLELATARIAIQAQDISSARAGLAGVEGIIDARGEGDLVYSKVNVPSAGQVTDWAPYVQPILDSDPDIVASFLEFGNEVAFSAAIHAAGYDGPVVNFQLYVPGLLDAQPDVAAALEGTQIVTPVPPLESDTPAVEQITADFEAAGIEGSPSLGGLVGWFSADQFLQMLEAVGPDLTPESFVATVNGRGWTYDGPDGGVGAVSFPDGHEQPQPCSAMVIVRDGAYDALTPMECFEVITE